MPAVKESRDPVGTNQLYGFMTYYSKAVADGPVGQVLAGPVSECNKNILIISITMLT